ncbi:protein of unknown function [Pseudodesulfovibrio profundus]|uniref:Uncharacterized protein n=1 Tax=Pseudodesulfovibrio profundus TaxID=57320 RepID=A0A2C8FBY4_9BACT|nr:protein of unknown function [Pseudodesulfovibrio profundus]
MNPCYRRERPTSWTRLDDGDAWMTLRDFDGGVVVPPLKCVVCKRASLSTNLQLLALQLLSGILSGVPKGI